MMRRLLFIGLLAMLAMMDASAQMLTQVSGTVLDSTTGKVLMSVKVTGGPVLPIQLDFVKQRDFCCFFFTSYHMCSKNAIRGALCFFLELSAEICYYIFKNQGRSV